MSKNVEIDESGKIPIIYGSDTFPEDAFEACLVAALENNLKEFVFLFNGIRLSIQTQFADKESILDEYHRKWRERAGRNKKKRETEM